jgi:hypothetical protein
LKDLGFISNETSPNSKKMFAIGSFNITRVFAVACYCFYGSFIQCTVRRWEGSFLGDEPRGSKFLVGHGLHLRCDLFDRYDRACTRRFTKITCQNGEITLTPFAGYLEQGMMVYEAARRRWNYLASCNWWYDVASMLPTDIAYLWWDRESCQVITE